MEKIRYKPGMKEQGMMDDESGEVRDESGRD